MVSTPCRQRRRREAAVTGRAARRRTPPAGSAGCACRRRRETGWANQGPAPRRRTGLRSAVRRPESRSPPSPRAPTTRRVHGGDLDSGRPAAVNSRTSVCRLRRAISAPIVGCSRPKPMSSSARIWGQRRASSPWSIRSIGMPILRLSAIDASATSAVSRAYRYSAPTFAEDRIVVPAPTGAFPLRERGTKPCPCTADRRHIRCGSGGSRRPRRIGHAPAPPGVEQRHVPTRRASRCQGAPDAEDARADNDRPTGLRRPRGEWGGQCRRRPRHSPQRSTPVDSRCPVIVSRSIGDAKADAVALRPDNRLIARQEIADIPDARLVATTQIFAINRKAEPIGLPARRAG